ncbi:MAG: hypothetical protein JST90_14755 [Bacteroidetes bacterium]|nr:hypothetical protein [Bacteroidota bacterium]
MKLVNVAICIAISLTSLAQQCSNDSLQFYPAGDINYQGAGFADPSDLPCVTIGSYSEIVIPFALYSGGARILLALDSSSVPVSQVYAVRIDAVAGLPSGMCWTVRQPTSSSAAALIIKGTTSSASAQYPLDVTLAISTQSGGAFNYTSLRPYNYKAILGQPVVSVADVNGNCPTNN